VQVARMRKGLCASARLQAARGAPSQHPSVHLRRVSEDVCAHGRAEPASAFGRWCRLSEAPSDDGRWGDEQPSWGRVGTKGRGDGVDVGPDWVHHDVIYLLDVAIYVCVLLGSSSPRYPSCFVSFLPTFSFLLLFVLTPTSLLLLACATRTLGYCVCVSSLTAFFGC